MDVTSTNPLACINVGSNSDSLSCCYMNDLSKVTCQEVFASLNETLADGCHMPTDECIAQCQNVTFLYSSLVQDGYLGASGLRPIQRYAACVNMPSISRALAFDQLPSNLAQQWFGKNAADVGDDELENMTSAVTECLTSTCSASRQPSLCQDKCSPVKILFNNRTPNLTAIDGCLDQLCNNSNYSSLPFADTDIVGIGVFASYIMQCVLLVIFWLCFCYLLPKHQADIGGTIELYSAVNDSASILARETTGDSDPRLKTWSSLLEDFHKAQCWFVGSLMVASFVSGIHDKNMLIIFMLIPPTLNGILPTVFAYFLLIYYKGVENSITILTVIVYVLSSVVYWSLYSQIIGLAPFENLNVYGQFTYKLSENKACGGFSALAVCPDYNTNGSWSGSMTNGFEKFQDVLNKLHRTPLIWTISTILLFGILACYFLGDKKGYYARLNHNTLLDQKTIFAVITVVFLAGIGIQLSLFNIATSLQMMNGMNWTFGQIVAVTIWIPTVAGALWGIVDLRGGVVH